MNCHTDQHQHGDEHSDRNRRGPNWFRILAWAAGLGAIAGLAYWFYQTGRASLLGYGLLLLCPLLHLLIPGGHGSNHGSRRQPGDGGDS